MDAILGSLDAGVNFIDTAEGYGHGASEELVGKALQGRRHEAIICTKVSPEHHRRDDVVRACEASLRRLRTDYIDLYMLHWPNHDMGFDEPLRALETLRDQGKVRAIGVSNFARRDLEDIEPQECVVADQLPYNLLWRAIEYEVAPECMRQEIGIICYSSLMHGLLTGKYASADEVPAGQARSGLFSGTRPLAPHDRAGAEAEVFSTIEDIRAISRATGHSMVHLALGWLMAQPGVTSAVVGACTAGEARCNAETADLELDEETLNALGDATNGLKEHFGSENPDLWQRTGRMR